MRQSLCGQIVVNFLYRVGAVWLLLFSQCSVLFPGAMPVSYLGAKRSLMGSESSEFGLHWIILWLSGYDAPCCYFPQLARQHRLISSLSLCSLSALEPLMMSLFGSLLSWNCRGQSSRGRFCRADYHFVF